MQGSNQRAKGGLFLQRYAFMHMQGICRLQNGLGSLGFLRGISARSRGKRSKCERIYCLVHAVSSQWKANAR
jgi:hypothetical protein